MNILFLSGQYPPHTKGGGEISTHLIAQGLVRLGHNVTVIAEGDKREHSNRDGVQVVRLQIPLTKKVLFERRASRKMAVFLRAQLKDLSEYDVLHAHDWRSALVLSELTGAQPAFAQNVGEARTVVTVRDYAQISGDTNHILADGTVPETPIALSTILRSHRIAEAKGIRRAMRAAQYLLNINYRRKAFGSIPNHIFISRAQRTEIAKHQDLSAKHTRVIYNPIAPDYMTKPLHAGRPGVVWYTGNVEWYKGVGLLLEAWKEVIKKHPRARLFLGEGNWRQRYEKQALKLGLASSVSFVGRIPAEKMIDRYDEASVVVAPHLWIEPFGRTVVEAMARGKIVVAANIGGPTEIIKDNETGLLFEAGSVEALTKRLSDALAMDRYTRNTIQKTARQWVQEHLTIENIAKQHSDFYTQQKTPT